MGWLRAPPPNTLATSRSFHTQRNWKIASEAMAGTDSGMTIFRKIVMWLAPSTRAASITSLGREPMKFFSRKIAIGMPKMAWASQIEGMPSSGSFSNAVAAEEAQQRDEAHLQRHDHQRHDEHRQGVTALEVHPRQGVGGERGDHDRDDRARHGDAHGVPEERS